MNQEILHETEKEKGLKDYFKYMVNVYGENVATETTIVAPNARDSLLEFSERFSSYTDADIYTLLLRYTALAKDDDNEYIKYAKKRISEGKIDDLILDMQSNKHLTKAITENFVNNLDIDVKDLYYKSRQNEKTGHMLRNMRKLDSYAVSKNAEEKKEVEKVKSKVPVKVKA